MSFTILLKENVFNAPPVLVVVFVFIMVVDEYIEAVSPIASVELTVPVIIKLSSLLVKIMLFREAVNEVLGMDRTPENKNR